LDESPADGIISPGVEMPVFPQWRSTVADKKTAPNVFHSEPSFSLQIPTTIFAPWNTPHC
jgi:hypothetical protein